MATNTRGVQASAREHTDARHQNWRAVWSAKGGFGDVDITAQVSKFLLA
ncbi:hypothetical protein [Ruegeria sp. Alg231-54]|nr:hypothetical protein [Ruegeria sp. Alg231-54]